MTSEAYVLGQRDKIFLVCFFSKEIDLVECPPTCGVLRCMAAFSWVSTCTTCGCTESSSLFPPLKGVCERWPNVRSYCFFIAALKTCVSCRTYIGVRSALSKCLSDHEKGSCWVVGVHVRAHVRARFRRLWPRARPRFFWKVCKTFFDFQKHESPIVFSEVVRVNLCRFVIYCFFNAALETSCFILLSVALTCTVMGNKKPTIALQFSAQFCT